MEKKYSEKNVYDICLALKGIQAGLNMAAHGCYIRKTHKIPEKWSACKTEIELAALVYEISEVFGQYIITTHPLGKAEYVTITERFFDACAKLERCIEFCKVFEGYDGIRDDTELFLTLSSEYLQIVRNTAESFEAMRTSCTLEKDMMQKVYDPLFFNKILTVAASTENILDISLQEILDKIREGSDEYWKERLKRHKSYFMFQIGQAPENTPKGTIHNITA